MTQRGLQSTPPFTPRIAIIGFGMGAIGFTNALRHWTDYCHKAGGPPLQPRFTVYCADAWVGGKAAPRNRGAQFVDASHFDTMHRVARRLGIRYHQPLPDYDDSACTLPSGALVSGEECRTALQYLRHRARLALQKNPQQLDQLGAVAWINRFRSKAGLSREQCEAMRYRIPNEEGVSRFSALHYAIILTHSETPMGRMEVIGGMHQFALREMAALQAAGVDVHMNSSVRSLQIMDDKVAVYPAHDIAPTWFDYALLAIAPEHYHHINISGSSLALDYLAHLHNGRIFKTNVQTNTSNLVCATTPTYTLWRSVVQSRKNRPNTATFFHGAATNTPLTDNQMLALLGLNPNAAPIDTMAWDHSNGHTYTSVCAPQQCMPLIEGLLAPLLDRSAQSDRLFVANHATRLGCYTNDALTSGEAEAKRALRQWGYDVPLHYRAAALATFGFVP